MSGKLSLAAAIAVATTTLSGITHAAASWDYAEADIILNGKYDPDGGDSVDFDGYAFDASTSFNSEMFFLRGRSNSVKTNDRNLSANNDLTLGEWTSIGPGFHFPTAVGGMGLDLWAQLTLDQGVLLATAVDGIGGSVGARLNITPSFEAALSYQMSSMDGSIGGVDTSLEPNTYTLEGLYYVTPSSAIRLGYTTGSADLDGSLSGFNKNSMDLSEIQFGFRHVFDAEKAGNNRSKPDPLSFNYFQLTYIFSGDSSIKATSTDYQFDAQRGYGIDAGFEVGDILYFAGNTTRIAYEDKDGGLALPGDNISVSDSYFFGPGAHFALTDNLEVYGQAGMDRMHFLYVPLDGYGIKVGGRVRLGMAEVNLHYLKGKVDGEYNNETLKYDGDQYGADVALEFSPDYPELVVSYTDGSYDLKYPNAKGNVDFKQTAIGMRQRF